MYRLRNFDNNYQVVNSVGWILMVVSLIFVFTQGMPGFLLVTAFGVLLVWWQLRGKRIQVNLETRTVKSGSHLHRIMNPVKVFMNRKQYTQNVNSRVSSTQVKVYFYKAYLEDGEDKILLSSNRKEERDLKKLRAIASDLNVPFEQNY